MPCYVDIDVNVIGDANGGTAYYSITAEQDLGATGQLKIWSAIVENNFMAGGTWGGYAGQEMMWIPRAIPAGPQGMVVSFTGPYPQTINLTGPAYTLNCSANGWNFANMAVVSFVQMSTGTKEVLNASYIDLPDTGTGVEGPEGGPIWQAATIEAWPNPSSGSLSIGAAVPGGTAGTVRVFDTAGRVVDEFAAGDVVSLSISEPGVYFARLETTDGQVASTRFTVVR